MPTRPELSATRSRTSRADVPSGVDHISDHTADRVPDQVAPPEFSWTGSPLHALDADGVEPGLVVALPVLPADGDEDESKYGIQMVTGSIQPGGPTHAFTAIDAVLPNEREAVMPFCGGGVSSRSRQTSPFSSDTIRSPTTVIRSRDCLRVWAIHQMAHRIGVQLFAGTKRWG